MADQLDDERILALWAAAVEPRPVASDARARLLAALEAERYLPFCAELAARFDLAEQTMRALLSRIVDPRAWTPGVPPLEAFIDFAPGPALQPLKAGFLRLSHGAQLARHRHAERELSFVLEGDLVDGEGRVHGPGASIDMPAGSVHSLGVGPSGMALVALLHGGIELLQD